jgi:cation transport regulator
MPYFSIDDLPDPVKKHLPKKAQEIYRKAFNKVWDAYRDESTLPAGGSRVELAAKIAWTEVKKEYIKKKTRWVKIKK